MNNDLSFFEQRKDELSGRMKALIEAAEQSPTRALSEDQTAEFDGLCESMEIVKGQIERLERAERTAAAIAESTQKYGTANGLSRAYVNRESGPYTPDSSANGGASFFRDLLSAKHGDRGAIDRLARNEAHYRTYSERATLTGVTTSNSSAGTFVPPLWLEQDFVPFVRPSRPTWNLVNTQVMPAGTDSINIPKVATGTDVNFQGLPGGTNELTQITEADLTTNSVSTGVYTVAGGQTVSMQLIEQSPLNIDQVVFQDLSLAYGQRTGGFLLNGTGSSQPTGILATTGIHTIAAATVDAPGIYTAVAQAKSQIETSRFMPATHIVMHPRRWNWLVSQHDSQGRPLVVPTGGGAFNAMGIADNSAAEGAAGTLLGLPVILDSQLPTNHGSGTNEDPVLVMRSSDVWTFESTLKLQAFEQTFAQNLSLFIRAYAYIGIIANRYPVAIAEITGLTAPAGF